MQALIPPVVSRDIKARNCHRPIDQLRYLFIECEALDEIVDGGASRTPAGSSSPGGVLNLTGMAIHAYLANRSMTARVFCDADGELLIVPQQGRLRLATELGILAVAPGEIAVVPRSLRFRKTCKMASRS